MHGPAVIAVFALMAPAAAEARDLCAERPGLGTPACTVDPSHLQVETGLADWTRDRDAGTRTDTISLGTTELRLGIGSTSEVQFGWTPYGYQRTRDAAGIMKADGIGDVRIGFKQNLANPDGHGLSIAVLPFATLPTGREPVGDGDWSAGVIAPVTYDLTEAVQLEFTPEVDAAVDSDGHGRHLAYSSVAGAEFALTDAVELTAEIEATRDRDPDGQTMQWLGALSAAWQPSHTLQLDIGTAVGLDHDAPGLRIYGGIAALF